MTTKVIILGKQQETEPKKKIQFVKILCTDLSFREAESEPIAYKNIELICRNYGDFDLMFVYNEDRNDSFLCLGHFNDGVV